MEGKEKKRKGLVIALLLLFGLTAGHIAATYAKYAGTFNGSGTVTVAKWAFESDNSSGNFNIDLDKTYDADTLVNGKIAPGTSGSFVIELSNANTEVGVDYTITFGSTTNKPTNLTFNGGGTVTGTLKPGQTGVTETITWEWPYETTNGDADDTTDGEAANTMTVNATITGVQVQPTE